MSCANSQIVYDLDGTQRSFSFPFEYLGEASIRVELLDEDAAVYNNVPQDDADNPWTFLNPTTIQFTTAPDELENGLRIRRVTNINPMETRFYPGSSIRAQDLNDNFQQLQMGLEEARCSLPDGAVSELDDRYWNKLNADTAYNDEAGSDWTTEPDAQVASVGAISRRLDQVVQDDNPGAQVIEGKLWIETDGNRLFFWNADTEVFVQLASNGQAATVNVADETITGDPGTNASVRNTGTENAAVFEFTIPRGDVGPRGPAGTGVQFRGTIDATTADPPADAEEGDMWVNTVGGTVNVTWDDIGGNDIHVNDRIVWNGTQWQIIPTGGVAVFTASADAPDPAVLDQLWFNTTTNQLYAGIGDPVVWTPTVPVVVQNGEPTDTDFTGELWYSPNDGILRLWDGSEWVEAGGGANVSVGDAAPADPENGDLWWNTDDGNLYVYYVDADDTEQWVISNTVATGGTTRGGGADLVFQENQMICTTDYTLTAGFSALSAGPITINDDVTITIPDNQNWVIL